MRLEVLNRHRDPLEGSWFIAEVPCEHCGRQGRKIAEEMSYDDAVAVARLLGELVNDPGREAF